MRKWGTSDAVGISPRHQDVDPIAELESLITQDGTVTARTYPHIGKWCGREVSQGHPELRSAPELPKRPGEVQE